MIAQLWVRLIILGGIILLVVGSLKACHDNLIEKGRELQREAQRKADVEEGERRAAAAKEIDREAKRMQAQAERDRVASDAAHGELRATVATFLERNRAPAAGKLPAAGSGRDPLDLFAELFTGMDARGREVARFADAAHRAGLGCQRQYDSLTQMSPLPPGSASAGPP